MCRSGRSEASCHACGMVTLWPQSTRESFAEKPAKQLGAILGVWREELPRAQGQCGSALNCRNCRTTGL